MKSWLLLALSVTIFCHIQGDTKILHKVNIISDQAFRQETFSLKNENTADEELVIEGSHSQHILSKDNPIFVYRIETIYVADKDGYRVKYIIVRQPQLAAAPPPDVTLNPSSLKGLAG